MEKDPSRARDLLVGLEGIDVVGVNDEQSEPLVVRVRTRMRHRPLFW